MCLQVIYKSLIYLLEHDGDVEEDIMITFKVQYKDVYSEMQSHELKDDGENIPVTNHNRQVSTSEAYVSATNYGAALFWGCWQSRNF